MDFDFSNITNAVSEFFSGVPNLLDVLSSPIALVSGILTIVTAITTFVTWFVKRKSWLKKEMSQLSEIADTKKVQLIKSNKFIPTMGQDKEPHDGDTIYIDPDRYNLLDKLMTEFESIVNTYEKKRYMIMGGSGMGKSTFLAALLYNCVYKYNIKKYPYTIYVKPLIIPNVIEQIKSINDNNSILLLDALDENIEASKDLVSFMNQLEQEAHKFKIVVITCRTQFYEDAESEPLIWSIPITGASGNRRIMYRKIYISPFDEVDVRNYLINLYGDSDEKFEKATIIAEKCVDLMSRPMILSFMDDLLDLSNIDNIKSVEIYSKIVDKWFERESEINNIKIDALREFSKRLAVFMYEKWKMSNTFLVSKEEYHLFMKENGFSQDPYSYNGRSLINRTSTGERKFSHRSLWELFLAMDSFEHPGRVYMLNGLDMAIKFQKELFQLDNKEQPNSANVVDFLESNVNSDFWDTEISRKFEEIHMAVKFRFHKPVQNLIFELSEMLMKRLSYQFSSLFNFCSPHKEPPLFVTELFDKIDLFFLGIQHVFINPNIIDIRTVIPKITNLYKDMCSLIPEQTNNTNIPEQIFVFPYALKEQYKKSSHFKCIHVGLSFSDVKEVIQSLSVFNNMDPVPLVYLYIEDNDIHEITSVILESHRLVTKIENCKLNIIVRTCFKNTFVDYYVYKSHRILKESDIFSIVCNMIQYKSQNIVQHKL